MKDGKIKNILIKINNYIYVKRLKFKDQMLKKKIGVPQIMSIDDTIDYIKINKCSISRFGDGELKIASGQGIRFQEYSKKLSERLKQIVKSNSNNCLICLTDTFDNISWMMPSAYEYTWRIVEQNRKNWTELLNLSYNYGNAFISRFYIDRKDKSDSERLFKKIKTLWLNRDIVIVEGEESRIGVNNDLFSCAKSIKRILCPQKNAFSYYDRIFNAVLKIPKENLIIIALGPTATVLAYDLCEIGYQALDIGHIDIEYEWFLMGAVEKVKVEGKYTSEAKDGDLVKRTYTDDEYENEIIEKINM